MCWFAYAYELCLLVFYFQFTFFCDLKLSWLELIGCKFILHYASIIFSKEPNPLVKKAVSLSPVFGKQMGKKTCFEEIGSGMLFLRIEKSLDFECRMNNVLISTLPYPTLFSFNISLYCYWTISLIFMDVYIPFLSACSCSSYTLGLL